MHQNNQISQNTKVKLLDPKIDAVFQILFSKSKPEVIKGLLSAILNMPISNFTNNTINLDLNKILDRSYPTDKIGVLEVRAQINNEIEIDLEMQMVYQDMLLERILWYWAKLYSSQLKSSDEYSELKKTIEILIVNDTIPSLENIFKPCTRWHIREDEIFSEVLTDKFEIVIIELPKVEQAYLKNKDNLLLQWMMFLLNPESLEVAQIMQENESVKIATQELAQVSEDLVNQRIAELREKARRDDKALFNTGKRIGREEAEKELNQRIAELQEKARRDDKALFNTGKRIGREEGLTQGTENGQKLAKEQIAKKLLTLNVPIEKITEATGLSIEEIQKFSEH